jgi:hypothetical protein
MKKNIGETLLIGLKGIIASILTSIVMLLPYWVVRLITRASVALGVIFALITIPLAIFVWGWIANKLWKWN